MAPERFLCIHGHFYQPPRENPWLEDIEIQDSAQPDHDWNQRITRECYSPNTASRVMDPRGRIRELVDNYSRISFNFGPTLLHWMERHASETYRRILDADRVSAAARGGHGNAIAQVYNHLIMPLASRRDKETQVAWGVHDFVRRFGRKPEGLWLSETAVDTETLEVLIDHGIRFTFLSPLQARRVRPARRSADRADGGPATGWVDVAGGRIDPSRPYLWRSAAGKTIALFFYDAPISRAVAFEGVLNDGEAFAARLLSGFAPDREGPQFVSIATDGESYGHHHRFGDMALAVALDKIQKEGGAVITNPGEFLSAHPPAWEVEIAEGSSWSCPHGVERWRSDCGCRMGGHPHWTQEWRAPLRDALNGLAEGIDRLFEERGGRLFTDTRRARNAYIAVILDRGPESLNAFFNEHARGALSAADRTEAVRLLEMERHRLLMFTSCAWFFDEISGLESTTVLLSAARSLQLARTFTDDNALEDKFLTDLSRARSNIPEYGTGADVYNRFVRPVVAELPRLAAHQALKGVERDPAEAGRLYCYAYRFSDLRTERAGGNGLSVGQLRIESLITGGVLDTAFGVLHLGGHDFHCVLNPALAGPALTEVKNTLFDAFNNASLTEVLALFSRHFEPRVYTLQDLLLEERRRTLSAVIEDILTQFDGTHRALVDQNRKLMNYLQKAGQPLPHVFRLALESVLGRELSRAAAHFTEDEAGADGLRRVHREAALFQIQLNWSSLAKVLERRVLTHVRAVTAAHAPQHARSARALLRLGRELDLPLDLWEAENVYFHTWNTRLRTLRSTLPDGQVYAELAEDFRLVV